MHIRSFSVNDIRALRKVVWRLPNDQASPGWHVILGTNGSGKSTFLQALAVTLLGGKRAEAVRLEKGIWIHHSASEGLAAARFTDSDQDRTLKWHLKRSKNAWDWFFTGAGNMTRAARDRVHEDPFFPGFLSAFGPFRRFGRGIYSIERQGGERHVLDRHLSLFDDNMAFGDSIDWLQQLRFQQLEKKVAGSFLESLVAFINQEGFLPFGLKLEEVSSTAVIFRDGNDALVPIEELSDGYRTVLCLTLELIRQFSHFYGSRSVFGRGDSTKVTAAGVVLIDEIDVHLHPQWQREIGLWFREHFPNVQFFVTTHSPLVCQAAEVGTVFVLPDPGTDEVGRMITGTELDRLLYGNVLEAFGTAAFDVPFTRSEAGREKLSRLAELNVKETRDGLTKQEQAEQHRLRAAFPTEAHARRNGASNP